MKLGSGLYAGIFVGASALSTVTVHAECISPRFNYSNALCNGCTYQGSMTMRRDEACEKVYGGFQGTYEFLGNRVIARAKHGVAGANGTTFAYKPSKGFVGRDEFTVEVAYRQGRETGKFQVRWDITVQ